MRPVRIGARASQDRDVEYAAAAADEVISVGRLFDPAVARPAALARGDAVRLHEAFEHAARLRLHLVAFLLEPRDRHGAHDVGRDHLREAEAQGEPFDVGAEPTRQQERGLQHRIERVVLLDWNQDRLHGMAFETACPYPPLATRRTRLTRRSAYTWLHPLVQANASIKRLPDHRSKARLTGGHG